MKIITATEMQTMDKNSQVPAGILMERAGKGLADFIMDSFPAYPVVFVCGTGNNGGDGFVAARHLLIKGREIEVFVMNGDGLKGLAHEQARKLPDILPPLEEKALSECLKKKAIVVDCLLGTGFKPPLQFSLKSIIEIINEKSIITVSCDIPTGVSGDTGETSEFAVDADATVTFAYPKVGHVVRRGAELTGSLEVVDIGIGLSPGECYGRAEITVREDCSSYFRRRPKASHKKQYGHILVAGGACGMEGAAVMSALGALRAGAGLVTCAVGRSICSVVSSSCLSAMALPLDEKDGFIAAEAAESVLEFAKKRSIDCVVIGPGLGNGSEAYEFVKKLLGSLKCPVVLDADGLNAIANDPGVLGRATCDLLVTPHPGEMARLTGMSVLDVQSARFDVARDFAHKFGCTVLLKGYRTVISQGESVYVNCTGNPGMATGGSGDILSGMAAALIGSGTAILESARTAAWIHGRAADIAAWNSSARYVLPDDIIAELKSV